MNLEMHSAEIRTNQSYAFVFSTPINEFMIGFSRFTLQYPRPDHHVQRISIDLSDARKNGTEVIVKPQLKICDTNEKHEESLISSIVVNVIAIVGNGNPYVHMIPQVEGDSCFELHANPLYLKSTLITADVEYPDLDHHVWKYESQLEPVFEGNKCTFAGKAKLQDNGSNIGTGKVKGSILVYTGSPQNLMCADFDSKKIRNPGIVCFGDVPEDFKYEDYDVACFVTGYEVSFESPDKDHHVLKVEIAADLAKNGFFRDNDKLCAKVLFRSLLVDNGEHQFDVPHNSVSGFVIAFKNK